jgi:hypothetical protein
MRTRQRERRLGLVASSDDDPNRTDHSACQSADWTCFGAYLVWWSLQVLDGLTPEVDGPMAFIPFMGFHVGVSPAA